MFGFSSLTNSWELQSWFTAILLKQVLCCFSSTTTPYHRHHHRYLNKRQINPFGKNRREKRSWFFIKLPSPWQKATMTMLLWLWGKPPPPSDEFVKFSHTVILSHYREEIIIINFFDLTFMPSKNKEEKCRVPSYKRNQN